MKAALLGKRSDGAPQFESRAWTIAAVSLVVISGMDVINEQIDILLLGMHHGASSVGIYVVAKRGAALVAFAAVAVSIGIAPAFSSLFAMGDRKRLQAVVTHYSRWVLLISTVIAVTVILFRRPFLGLFGAGFVSGESTVTILVIGQWISAAMGAVAGLLVMTGHSKEVAIGIGAGTIANVLLCMVLIPRMGAVGAAIAVAARTLMWNLILTWFVRQRLDLSAAAWGNSRLD
jgi:O-antigen/teichoic acid export membrane protein